MHEAGIASGILDIVSDTARGASASRAVAVTVRIGDMVEVVDEALRFAWDALSELDPLTDGCELAVVPVHPESRCRSCGETFGHSRFHVRCPACGSADTELLHGRELDIVSVEVETDDGEGSEGA